LDDLQNSFTTAKSSKFPTKPILCYPPHLMHYLEKLKNQKLAVYKEHKTHFKCDWFCQEAICKTIENFA